MTCSKKYFRSAIEANEFESLNRAKYNHVQQYSYKCPNCDGYHLSAQPPGANTIAQFNYDNMGAASATRTASRETKGKVLALHAQGKNQAAIAAELGITQAGVSYHLNPPKSVPSKSGRPNGAALSLESLSQQEQDLQQKLEKIAAQKAALQEALRFKISWAGDKILVQKEGNSIVASVEDWSALFDKFNELLDDATRPTEETAVGAN